MAHRPHPQDTRPMDLFVDLASGWTCWMPRWTAEVDPAGEDPVVAAWRQGRRLLGRLSARLHARRPDGGAA